MHVDRKPSARSGALTRRVLLGTMAAFPLIGQTRFARAQAAEALSVRVDFAPWGVHAALHLAQAKGWLKEDNLAVDIQDGTGTLSTINLVAAGKVDVGFVQLGPIAIARASGLPLKSFACYLRRAAPAVMLDAVKGPRPPKELPGKQIVCFANRPWPPFVDQSSRH